MIKVSSTTVGNIYNEQQEQKVIGQLSELKGLLQLKQFPNIHEYKPMKIAKKPYECSRSMYKKLNELSLLWQKYTYLASQNTKLLIDTYKETVEMGDPFITHLVEIMEKTAKVQPVEAVYYRTDFIIDLQQKPKIVQYNTDCVSMCSHSEHLDELFRLTGSIGTNIESNKPATLLIDLITNSLHSGIVLMIVEPQQSNILDQQYISIGLQLRNITCKRITLLQLYASITINHNKQLYYQKQLVGLVYYRTGLALVNFQHSSMSIQQCMDIYCQVQLSSSVTIPTINMKLINQKRMQIELSKSSVYTSLLSSEQAEMLKHTLVETWQFDHMSEQQYASVVQTVSSSSGQGYILKSNHEGGSGNIFDEQCLLKMQNMPSSERVNYILMKKINTQPSYNTYIQGKHVQRDVLCDYQVSIYGTLEAKDGQIIRNQTDGYLIRSKKTTDKQCGIMSGTGAICACKINDL